MKGRYLLRSFIGISLLTAACSEPHSKMETQKQHPEQPSQKVEKSDLDWKKSLTPEQYRILRRSGTEAPNGATYRNFEKQGEGTYYCAGCQAELFTSNEKFHSGCGWPSFYDPSKPNNITEKKDASSGMERIEVVCSTCDGHLGHVFLGEGFSTPTDKRYCINGAALLYVPAETDKPEAPSEQK